VGENISNVTTNALITYLKKEIKDENMLELVEKEHRRYLLLNAREDTTQAMSQLYHTKNFLKRIINIAGVMYLMGSINMDSIKTIVDFENKEYQLLDADIKKGLQKEHEQIQKLSDEKYLVYFMRSKGIISQLKKQLNEGLIQHERRKTGQKKNS